MPTRRATLSLSISRPRSAGRCHPKLRYSGDATCALQFTDGRQGLASGTPSHRGLVGRRLVARSAPAANSSDRIGSHRGIGQDLLFHTQRTHGAPSLSLALARSTRPWGQARQNLGLPLWEAAFCAPSPVPSIRPGRVGCHLPTEGRRVGGGWVVRDLFAPTALLQQNASCVCPQNKDRTPAC